MLKIIPSNYYYNIIIINNIIGTIDRKNELDLSPIKTSLPKIEYKTILHTIDNI